MLKILVVEGNSPALVADAGANGQTSNAENYGTVLHEICSEVQFEIFQPYLSTDELDAEYLSQFDGAAFTGAGVDWSTSAPEAHPQRSAMECIFAANIPTIGSCNGLQLANVVLGGETAVSPDGLEIGLAKNIQLSEFGQQHLLHKGRRSGFSCTSIHRDQIARPPSGAQITAENEHSIQGLVYELGGVKFWGLQYHPELSLQHIADYLYRERGLFSKQNTILEKVERAIENPDRGAEALGGIQQDLALPTRVTELRNWLSSLNSQTT